MPSSVQGLTGGRGSPAPGSGLTRPLCSEIINYEFDTKDLVCLGLSSIVGVWYLLRKHWIANNLFGLAFSLNGVELLHLNNVSTGCILLGGLFIYDVFWVSQARMPRMSGSRAISPSYYPASVALHLTLTWEDRPAVLSCTPALACDAPHIHSERHHEGTEVFGTNVMVTVAKSFEAPIKCLASGHLVMGSKRETESIRHASKKARKTLRGTDSSKCMPWKHWLVATGSRWGEIWGDSTRNQETAVFLVIQSITADRLSPCIGESFMATNNS
ncbi:hypothetical protein P7K49_009522 [Saguinus oedipus]|uniref:Histocompatibility minor 13 n=1 Tax=Saguinus oedipus TaxID=9490 RepID=A0ABQ9VKU9_SAGOE|nr:hypothetical protein P7K49_009522 [Saguinus oedipus]